MHPSTHPSTHFLHCCCSCCCGGGVVASEAAEKRNLPLPAASESVSAASESVSAAALPLPAASESLPAAALPLPAASESVSAAALPLPAAALPLPAASESGPAAALPLPAASESVSAAAGPLPAASESVSAGPLSAASESTHTTATAPPPVNNKRSAEMVSPLLGVKRKIVECQEIVESQEIVAVHPSKSLSKAAKNSMAILKQPVLQELESHAKGMCYTLVIMLIPVQRTTTATDQASKGYLRVPVDNQSSKACLMHLVHSSIEFSTEDAKRNKFWIIISKLPTNSNADCTISISQAGMNNDQGVTKQRFNDHHKAFMFLLEAIIWIFCFGTDLKFGTIEATRYEKVSGRYPSFQNFPRQVLGLNRKSGAYQVPDDYSSIFNITHSPFQW